MRRENGRPPEGSAPVADGAVAADLRQSILCLLEVSSPSGRTWETLSAFTGRGGVEVGGVLGRMRDAGEVALEDLPDGLWATITDAGRGRLREEIGEMVVLHRFLVDGQGEAS